MLRPPSLQYSNAILHLVHMMNVARATWSSILGQYRPIWTASRCCCICCNIRTYHRFLNIRENWRWILLVSRVVDCRGLLWTHDVDGGRSRALGMARVHTYTHDVRRASNWWMKLPMTSAARRHRRYGCCCCCCHSSAVRWMGTQVVFQIRVSHDIHSTTIDFLLWRQQAALRRIMLSIKRTWSREVTNRLSCPHLVSCIRIYCHHYFHQNVPLCFIYIILH